MSHASSDASMLAVAAPAPLRPTLLAVHSCTRQHANLLVPGQIVSGLVRNRINSFLPMDHIKANTPSVSNYNTFDFFVLRFNHSSYSKYCVKYYISLLCLALLMKVFEK
jgi:hypothetical protein